jgi:hypothetical protein
VAALWVALERDAGCDIMRRWPVGERCAPDIPNDDDDDDDDDEAN